MAKIYSYRIIALCKNIVVLFGGEGASQLSLSVVTMLGFVCCIYDRCVFVM